MDDNEIAEQKYWENLGAWENKTMEHEHVYDDVTGEPCICPVYGCWFNYHESE
jgi:hypothetical protein